MEDPAVGPTGIVGRRFSFPAILRAVLDEGGKRYRRRPRRTAASRPTCLSRRPDPAARAARRRRSGAARPGAPAAGETASGSTTAETPRTNSTFRMLLPTTLPRAMSAFPEKADCTVTAVSGELVPKATTVSPITTGEIPSDAARRDAPRTRSSAPEIKSATPTMNSMITRGLRRISCGLAGVRAISGRNKATTAATADSGYGRDDCASILVCREQKHSLVDGGRLVGDRQRAHRFLHRRGLAIHRPCATNAEVVGEGAPGKTGPHRPGLPSLHRARRAATSEGQATQKIRGA